MHLGRRLFATKENIIQLDSGLVCEQIKALVHFRYKGRDFGVEVSLRLRSRIRIIWRGHRCGSLIAAMDIGAGVMAGRGSWEAESVGGSFLFACGFLWHFRCIQLQVYLKLCYCNVFGSHYLFCVFICFLFFNTGL